MFRDSIPRCMATEGLLRKNVLYDEGLGGGAYLWESREVAERAFSAEWRAYMTEKYNHPPEVTFFESPNTMDRQYNAVHDEADLANAAE
jgi:hypothetical protein